MATNSGGLSLTQQRQRAAFWFIAPMLAALFFVAAWPLGVALRRRRRVKAPFQVSEDEALPHTSVPEQHGHVHGENCGHVAVVHGDHVDYVHDGHRHAEHGDHYDEH